MKDIVIIGAGGFGREVAWLIERINSCIPTWKILGFLDDDPAMHGAAVGGYPVLGGIDWLDGREVWAVCAIGSAKARSAAAEKVRRFAGVRFAALIDPSVIMSDRVSVGEDSIICAGTVITVDVTLGAHTIVNLGCTVGHDCVLGDCVTVYPGANISGNVTVGACTEIGTGTQIRQGINITGDVIVGAGAVVVKDIETAGTYAGVPAAKIK